MQIAIDYDLPHARVDIVLETEHVVRVPLAINENVQYFQITKDGLEEIEPWATIEEGLDVMTGTRLIDCHAFVIGIADEGFDVVDHHGNQLAGGLWEDQSTYDLSV